VETQVTPKERTLFVTPETHGDTVFAEEDIVASWDEALPLMRAHHVEVGPLPSREFDPSKEGYANLQAAGSLMTFSIRKAGELIGYATFYLSKPLHYKTTLFAMQDALYVEPAHRGMTAIRFIYWTDRVLKAEGAKYIVRHTSARMENGSMYVGLGYMPLDSSYILEVR